MNQTSSKLKFLKRAFLGILALLGILMVIGILLFPRFGPQSLGTHMNSWRQMESIAVALHHFRQEHSGVNPSRLSELVPVYLPAENLFFRSPYTTSVFPIQSEVFSPHSKLFLFRDRDHYSTSVPELMDVFSPYSFAVLKDQRILVFERPGMWSDGTMTYLLLDAHMQPVGTCQSCIVTPNEFQRRMLSQFQK